jgi:ApaG protein
MFDRVSGGFKFYDYVVNFRLLSIDEISDLHSMINSSRSRVPDWVTKCVPLAQSYNASPFWFMLKDDLTFPEYPGTTFKKGSIVVPSRNMRSCFPIAESITALMQHHVEQLENGILEVDAKGEIQRFPIKGIPEAITNHVRVRASPLFIPDQSVPNQTYTWSYRIFMDMAEDAPHSAKSQLTTRTWVITDATGKSDNVHGSGVIGFFPKMYPGATFSYESCCPLTTPTGTMSGSFQMASESSGEEFDAEVPQFNFVVPQILKEKPE